MKIQKLKIHNIASIVDAEIDFEKSALSDSEVFLITGKTGSGKSTILDSICLALYANTPRLKNTKMEGSIKDGGEDVRINDAVQLMRRNSVEAYVELTFLGRNEVHYRARWEVRRARRNIEGRPAEKWQLENLRDKITLQKKGEIKEEIQTAIGLDFDQFCRTTMLAQGEFTRFLNSKDNEKAAILEKITGVDIYSKIGAKIFEVRKTKSSELFAAQSHVDIIRQSQMTEEEIAQEKENLNKLETAYASLQTIYTSDNCKLNWLKTNKTLVEEVALAQQKYQQIEEYQNSAEFKNKECLVNDWRQTKDARGWMLVKLQAANNKKNVENVLGGFVDLFAKYLGGYNYLQQKISDNRERVKVLNSLLASESDKVTMYENAQTITALLNRVRDDKTDVENGLYEIERLKLRLEEQLVPHLNAANEKAQQAKHDLIKIESSINELNAEIASLKLRELRKEQQSIEGLLNNINVALKDVDQFAASKDSKLKKQDSLKKLSAEIERNRIASAELVDPVNSAKQEMDVCREKYDRQCATVDEFAQKLRLILQVGDVCPVCQQAVNHQLPAEEELQQLFFAQKEDYELAKQKYDKLSATKSDLDRTIEVNSEIYSTKLQEWEQDMSVEIAEQLAVKSCVKCGVEIDKIDESVIESLKILKRNTSERKFILDNQIAGGEAKEAALAQLRMDESTSRKNEESLKTEVKEAERQVDSCKSQIDTRQVLVDSKNQEIESASNKAKQLISADVWGIDWMQNPTDFITCLTEAKARYDKTVQDRNNIDNLLHNLKIESQKVEAAIQIAKNQMPSWTDCVPEQANEIENLEGALNELSRSISIEQLKLEQAEQAYNDNKKALDDFLVENPSIGVDRLKELGEYTNVDIDNETLILQTKRDERVAAETSLNEARKRQLSHQQEKPELGEDDTEELLKERVDGYNQLLDENSQKQGAIKLKIETNNKNESELQSKIAIVEQKKSEFDKWDRLNRLIGSEDGALFRRIAQSYVLSNLIHSANSYMRTLTDRYTLKVIPGTFVILIEDAYQGYVSRAASTISGGESFLVSLSLALALSDIDQKLSVDTLFIDEGFGTLSGEPLQNAINTLRSLHATSGRHVGIISHIEELRKCIPVQIQVNQEGNISSSTIQIIDTCG